MPIYRSSAASVRWAPPTTVAHDYQQRVPAVRNGVPPPSHLTVACGSPRNVFGALLPSATRVRSVHPYRGTGPAGDDGSHRDLRLSRRMADAFELGWPDATYSRAWRRGGVTRLGVGNRPGIFQGDRIRDRALLLFGFSSGGRRRSEVSSARIE